ncbi:hypothetical protein ES703_106253 [subsurface metagenome]
MSNTIICGMDAHDNTLSNRIGVNRETPETKTVKHAMRLSGISKHVGFHTFRHYVECLIMPSVSYFDHIFA